MSHEARVNSVSWKFAFHVFKQLKAQHEGGGGGVGGRWGERRQVPLTLRGSGAEGPVRGHRACELGLCFPAGRDPRFSSVALLRRQPRVASSPDQLGPASRSRGVPCPCAVPGAAARPSSQLWPLVLQAPRRERRARETRRCVPGSGRRRTRGRRRGRQHRCISANDRGPPRGTAASCRGARGPALRLPAPLCQGPSNRKISLGLLMRSWEN